jgi:hypothetical protein
MSTYTRRHRSSTAASTQPPTSAHAISLQKALEELSSLLQTNSGTPEVAKLAVNINTIERVLIDSPETARAKDSFRHLHGFSSLLDTLRATSGYYQTHKRSQDEREALFRLLGGTLSVLSTVFRDHYGNRRYFKHRVEGGGWAALEQAIASIGFGGSDSDSWTQNRLFGLLLAFAVDDQRLKLLCQNVQDQCSPQSTKLNKSEGEPLNQPESDNKSSTGLGNIEDAQFQIAADLVLEKFLSQKILFRNPEIIPTIIGFWEALPRDKPLAQAPAALLVIQTLSKISCLSQSNLLALHSTGILSTLLPLAFEEKSPLQSCERSCVEILSGSLISLGMSTLNDARYLLRSKSTKASDFLLQASKLSHNPPHIQFDLSLNGYASIELATLGRPFPPPSSVSGYTFTAWIYIDQFDPHVHTTIFGAFDSTQTCFVLAYLERDTHNFILQTSVTSSRPSVRFRSTSFQECSWYHIAIVHRRPKTISSSKASLYVNGEFAESVKCQYPANPPSLSSSTDSFASFASTSSTKFNNVQAFLGTPQDLSTRLGQGLVSSRWSLASAHLFEDALSDDFIAVHYGLGPRYNGNFQDCLGSFQTYDASAALGMRDELMHPGKDEKSDIVVAIRDKASTIVPEHRVLLSILPSAILSADESRGDLDSSQLIRGLTRNASSSLFQLTRNTGGSVALNAALPSINEALIRPNGVAVMTGDPVVVVPQAIDSAMWRLGGCAAIGLRLVQDASSRSEIVRAVEILFESVKASWRNSEAMERENGYAIIGALIRGKVGAGTVIANPAAEFLPLDEREKLGFELLSLVLGFVGYVHENPGESIVNNPLAYRILLVDFDMWRKAAPITQKLYYKQFTVFTISSKHHHFNSRRLQRMSTFISILRGQN